MNYNMEGELDGTDSEAAPTNSLLKNGKTYYTPGEVKFEDGILNPASMGIPIIHRLKNDPEW